jgi:hypothetical protein
MDLNVKLHRLKYILEKVQGVKCKNSTAWGFLDLKELFSYCKLHGLGPWNQWTGCTAPAHGSTTFIKYKPLASRSTTEINRIEPL